MAPMMGFLSFSFTLTQMHLPFSQWTLVAALPGPFLQLASQSAFLFLAALIFASDYSRKDCSFFVSMDDYFFLLVFGLILLFF